MGRDLLRYKENGSNRRLKLTLPIPTSVNAMYTMKRSLTADARKFQKIANALINEAIDEQNWQLTEKGVWIYIDMIYYFPDRKTRDSHNCLKMLMDVMQDRLYENDMYALPRIQSVEYDKENPRVEILITLQNKIQREKGMKMIK